jgi:hypothetical protein
MRKFKKGREGKQEKESENSHLKKKAECGGINL